MNWEAIGAIGEAVGSLAVLVTIGYLAVQMKQSSKSTRSASTNNVRAALTDVLSAISSDTEAVKTYAKGLLSRDELEVHERIRFDLIVFQTLRVTETLFLEYREGLVSQEVWEGQWRGEQSILKTQGGRESWAVQRNFLSRSFAEWVDEHLDL